MNTYRNTICAVASVIFTLTIVGFSSSAVATAPFVNASPATVTASL